MARRPGKLDHFRNQTERHGYHRPVLGLFLAATLLVVLFASLAGWNGAHQDIAFGREAGLGVGNPLPASHWATDVYLEALLRWQQRTCISTQGFDSGQPLPCPMQKGTSR